MHARGGGHYYYDWSSFPWVAPLLVGVGLLKNPLDTPICLSGKALSPVDEVVAMDSLLTVNEAAQVLRCDPRTVLELVRSGRLPALRLRRSYRIRRDALRVLDVQTAERAAEAPAGTAAGAA